MFPNYCRLGVRSKRDESLRAVCVNELNLSPFEVWPTMAEECAHIYKLSMWIRPCNQTCFDLITSPILGELRADSAVWKADFQNCHLLFYSYTLAAVISEPSCPFCMFILGG